MVNCSIAINNLVFETINTTSLDKWTGKRAVAQTAIFNFFSVSTTSNQEQQQQQYGFLSFYNYNIQSYLHSSSKRWNLLEGNHSWTSCCSSAITSEGGHKTTSFEI
jgi:hypothetical protein